ncbi:type II secretion system F family protein [Flavimobilis sp. GY10621]|uniref:Type II secretion system F family protein n=1 Tax=Flavimobilis rhizosphaerae TaxID=2775421 RepID=A0ABR9DNU3_9MICO|nr:type II secretion system F family protein [Flavimobilis rhizosphaerae]MBD9698779.1 type II secretion system F family protein [Flavimobilis rhizosphaerae]
MFTVTQVVLMGVGTVLLGTWIVLLVRGRQHDAIFANLDRSAFPLSDLYALGYEGLLLSGYSFQTSQDVKLRQLLDITFGQRYSEFYLRVLRSQQAAIGLTGTIAAFGAYGLTNSLEILGLAIVVACLLAFYMTERIKTQVRTRNAEMMRDFCEVISTLALLTNAGMILREAWAMTARGGSTAIYDEMRRSVERMENGATDVDAIQEFGTRSMLPEVKKVCALLVQSIHRGGADLPAMLTLQSAEAWQVKKQIVLRQSNKAGTKLLLPMMLMFAGILLMVIVPMFSSVGM